MATLLGEHVGARAGYVTRLERRVSARMRVEVVTTGVLLRRLQLVRTWWTTHIVGQSQCRLTTWSSLFMELSPGCSGLCNADTLCLIFEGKMLGSDHCEITTRQVCGILTCLVPDQDASLPGVAAVVLDEFHERSWDADLALTLCIDSQHRTRPDLRSASLASGVHVTVWQLCCCLGKADCSVAARTQAGGDVSDAGWRPGSEAAGHHEPHAAAFEACAGARDA